MYLKKISLFLFCVVLFSSLTAQEPKNYPDQWKKVEQFVEKGLTKSALEEVNKIYALAKKDNNDPQVIKTLLFRITLERSIQEDATVKSILDMEKEIALNKEPARSILNSITAHLYWSYFQRNRWKIYNRTNTADFKKDDIETWTIDDFVRTISTLYLASISNEKLLQQTKLETYDAIINKGNVRQLRPTLFDLLAHHALAFFENDERNITKPAYAFQLSDDEALGDAQTFSRFKFNSKDSTSLHLKALQVYQELIRFHLNDSKPDALIDVDIARISFVKTHAVMPDKEKLYRSALHSIVNKYPSSAAAAYAAYLIAQHVYNSGDISDESDGQEDKNKYAWRDAKNLLEPIITKFPGSDAAIYSQNLLTQILHKELKLTTEKVNVPAQPFRTLVSYRNFQAVNFRVIQLTPEMKKEIEENNRDNDQKWTKLANLKPFKSWKQPLTVTDDYRIHSTEVKTDGLPIGQYALLASVSEDFSLGSNPMSVNYFYVSNISFINNGNDYFILHRETGKPLQAAKVQVWTQRYDYNTRKNIIEKQELLTADQNGFIKMKQKKAESRNIRLEITYKDDKLFPDDYLYSYNYTSDEKKQTAEEFEKDNVKIFLFTDRSIYRPGQLVYFKGIKLTTDYESRKPKLVTAKDKVLVTLYDANSQQVDSVELTPNDFGSFNHSFRLPENRLNGNFRITTGDFSEYFSVEEYKRPKYYVDFEKVKGTYKVNETVRITGFAKAYAGNNIDGATVKYRVTRVARFLYPWMWWRKGLPSSQSMEITNGEMKSGADGKFVIEFKAIPDLKLDKRFDPVFDYRVEADVTDVNGETRSSSTIVPVGYKALNLQISIPFAEPIPMDSFKRVNVYTTNLSGQFEATQVNMKIFRLTPPSRMIRSRYWQQPDQFVMTKAQYLQYFPFDEYKDESSKETWARSGVIKTIDFTSTEKGEVMLQTINVTQGWYVIEVTAKDKYGQEVKNLKYFQVYDNSQTLPAPAFQWNAVIKNYLQPGEVAKFLSGTSAENIFLIQQVDKAKSTNRSKEPTTYSFHELNKEKKLFEFPVNEDDRGGFGVYQVYVKNNRVYTTSWNVFVPWSNKELDITFETFRDKTLPGSEEKWKVKIAGNKGDKVAAEMLAGMYDASLDQFREHSWSGINVWPSYSRYTSWQGPINFSYANSTERWWNDGYLNIKEKTYDQLAIDAMYSSTRRMRMAKPVAAESKAANMETSELVLVGNAQQRDKKEEGNQAAPPDGKSDDGLDTKDASTTKADNKENAIRKNFNETAFFFPTLYTDKDGSITFSFTIPEALTQWKLMLLAHSKDLASGMATKMTVTQKDLMVQPNVPRFLREGDKIEFSSKIVNLGTAAIKGEAELELLNATTMQPVNTWFKNLSPKQPFNIPAGQSAAVKFPIDIPVNYANALVYRIVARTENLSDGEENSLPVLTNRTLVTRTMPLPVRGNVTKTFTFEKLAANKSTSLSHHALTIEYTTNPSWLVVQALPFLAEPKYECADQIFNRYYANSLAQMIANSSPRIKAIFEKWKNADSSALLSNLQKNEELKAVLLQETPWVLEAKSEEQQKKNIALLFDMVRMSKELESAMNKLLSMQSSNGGFVWFKGGPDDRYMTQYIVTGIGHLQKLGAIPGSQQSEVKQILQTAIPYLDRRIKEDYDDLLKYKSDLKKDNIGYIQIQYLYMRSFFSQAILQTSQPAVNYYRDQAQKYWLSKSKYMQAMIALAMNRGKETTTAKAIIASLKENAIVKEEMGMYWKEWTTRGYFWYQAPIESQALMIEAFHEIDKNLAVVDDLKTWLLKNKQTNRWETTKATAEACYALLLQGTDWLIHERSVDIKLGSTVVSSSNEKQEAGTGYFKTRIDGSQVLPSMGNISVTVSPAKNAAQATKDEKAGTSWGAVYWQYFEDLDKITFAETPLKLNKKIFIEKNTDRGPVITPVVNNEQLKIGDKIKVRIELRVDREMEYVHMKDMRAACMEPVNVLSSYKWQGGLGYYETTKDASTNFFFNWLQRGTYVFEYTLFVTHAGNFSNGITTIQSMYAPEFTAHSEGIRVNVQ